MRTLVQRVDNVGLSSAEAPDLSFLMSLSFQTIPAQHRLGLVDEVVERQILEARHLFSISLPEGLRNAIAFFQPDKFNVAASIEDNILFGKMRYGRKIATRVVPDLIIQTCDMFDLRKNIIQKGLDFRVEWMGENLALEQRQKLAISTRSAEAA